jgi:hypothetical protein
VFASGCKFDFAMRLVNTPPPFFLYFQQGMTVAIFFKKKNQITHKATNNNQNEKQCKHLTMDDKIL